MGITMKIMFTFLLLAALGGVGLRHSKMYSTGGWIAFGLAIFGLIGSIICLLVTIWWGNE